MGKPDCSVPKELARMEQEKRREYGLGASNPSTLFDGVVPVIFEQHGCPGPRAITFLHHIVRRRVHKLEQGPHLIHGVAWMIASRDLFAPISCILLVMTHELPDVSGMLPHCANLGHPQGVGSHRLTTRPILLPYGLPRGTLARRRTLARPGLATQSGIHPRGGYFFLK